MATKQQDNRTETSNQERTERPAKVDRPRRDLTSWFSFGDWRVQTTTEEEWALA